MSVNRVKANPYPMVGGIIVHAYGYEWQYDNVIIFNKHISLYKLLI